MIGHHILLALHVQSSISHSKVLFVEETQAGSLVQIADRTRTIV